MHDKVSKPQAGDNNRGDQINGLHTHVSSDTIIASVSLTADTKYGSPSPIPPSLIACIHKMVISGAPIKDPSVFARMTMLKSWMSDSASAMRGDLTSDIVKTGRAEPRA